MITRLKTGIYCGSFNPIHIGHLALANYLCEFEDLDEVWFIITPHNPLKQSSELWPDDFRLQLVETAIDGYDKFKASDFEFNLPRPSYTINTLEQLELQYPDRQFELIIGSDNWKLFNRWVRYEDILAKFPIIIYPRPGYEVEMTSLPKGVRLSNAPTFEISSTFIRKALSEKRDIRYFLPNNVYQLIQQRFSQQ